MCSGLRFTILSVALGAVLVGSIARGSDAAQGACGWLGRNETSAVLKDRRSGGSVGDEVTLKIRPLLVDGLVKEWTTGDAHDVTDRSFVVRRVLRIERLSAR